jgi:cytosine/adenosine deaminase-related metal-dependent hydrolase
VIWCPASNLFLFGQTIAMADVLSKSERARVCLGTDSRLTGSRDLLDELRVAAQAGVASCELLRMVTSAPASILRMPCSGSISVGAPADLLVIPDGTTEPADAPLRATRSDVSLVVHQGHPRVGVQEMAPAFSARRITTRTMRIDEQPRIVDAAISRRIERSAVREPGVEVA